MEDEILVELNELNELLTKDFELRSEQLQLEQEKKANELELQEIAKAEEEANAPQKEVERAKTEQRAVQIEQYIKKIESDEEQEKQEVSRQEMIQAINALDQQDSLAEISEKLNALIEISEKTERDVVQGELNYFNGRALFMIVVFVVPCWLTIKYLGRLFDRASAF